ncbi:MAG TPA: DUF2306 domain-containing protein, partial [Leucothrix mucor]|nr:DUF2306 domain-containing protein [Leucothrix mucor]
MPELSILIHLIAASTALLLGGFILFTAKGTARHKFLGRIWAVSILVTAIGSFAIQISGRLSPIHILSVVSLISLFIGITAIRKGNVRTHRGAMVGGYTGLFIAFLFTFDPDRMIGQFALSLFR